MVLMKLALKNGDGASDGGGGFGEGDRDGVGSFGSLPSDTRSNSSKQRYQPYFANLDSAEDPSDALLT